MKQLWRLNPVRPPASALCALLALLLGLFLLLELRHPYFFLQDDNRAVALADIKTIHDSLSGGILPSYNFNQFLGYPMFTGHPALYPPAFASIAFSQFLFGHIFAALDIYAISHLLLAGAGMLFFLGAAGIGGTAAFFGALAWGLSPMAVHAGANWITVAVTAGWLPWMLFAALNFLKKPSPLSFAAMCAARTALMFQGYPQYFIVSCLFEILFALAFTSLQDTELAGASKLDRIFRLAGRNIAAAVRERTFLLYLASFVFTAALCAPILLPAFDLIEASKSRTGALSFAEFSYLNLSLTQWLKGLVYPFTHYAGHVAEMKQMDKLSYLGYLPLLFLGWKFSRRRTASPAWFAALLCAVTAWLWALGAFNPAEYYVPVLNRFRWHFKMLLFADFFLIAAAAAAAAEFLEEKKLFLRPTSWLFLLAGAHLINMGAFYLAGPRAVFRLYEESVPLREPMGAFIADGRIATVGFPLRHEAGAASLGFQYASLFGLFHFAGYEPLVPRLNAVETGGLNYEASLTGAISREQLARMRTWGVKYYVTPSRPAKRYVNALHGEGMSEFIISPGRNIFRDMKAAPLAKAPDGTPAGKVEASGGRLTARFARPFTGCAELNFLYHPMLRAEDDGVKLERSPSGRILACASSPVREIAIYPSNSALKKGLIIMLCAAAALAALFSAKRIFK